MVILSTVAAIIASQAVISGAFSVTRQAIRLGFLPRLVVRHTSRKEIGQVYVPAANWIIFAAVVALVRRLRLLRAARLGLRDRRHRHAGDRHAAVLLRRARALAPADVARVTGADRVPDRRPDVLRRQPDEGPARRLVPARDRARRLQRAHDLAARARDRHAPPDRGGGPAARASSTRCATPTRRSSARPAPRVFLNANPETTPLALRANVEHNHVLHECVLIVSLTTERVPYVPEDERSRIDDLGYRDDGITHITGRFGFQDPMDVPAAAAPGRRARRRGRPRPRATRPTSSRGSRSSRPTARAWRSWRKRLFLAISRNAANPVEVFHLPDERTVVMGSHIEL